MLTINSTMQIMRLLIFLKSHLAIVEQVQGEVKGERGKKQQQFATILHLL